MCGGSGVQGAAARVRFMLGEEEVDEVVTVASLGPGDFRLRGIGLDGWLWGGRG